jgi:hypothetical protein
MAGLSHREIALQNLARGYINERQFRLLEAKLFPPEHATSTESEPSVHVQIADYDLPLIPDKPIPRPGETPTPSVDPFAISPAKATSADIAAMAVALKTSPTK